MELKPAEKQLIGIAAIVWSFISVAMFVIGLLLSLDYRERIPVGKVLDSTPRVTRDSSGNTHQTWGRLRVVTNNGHIVEIDDPSSALVEMCHIGDDFPPFDLCNDKEVVLVKRAELTSNKAQKK